MTSKVRWAAGLFIVGSASAMLAISAIGNGVKGMATNEEEGAGITPISERVESAFIDDLLMGVEGRWCMAPS